MLTITIIGVVGAIVVPVVSTTHSKMERTAKIKKVYEILQSAALTAVGNDGDLLAATTSKSDAAGIKTWFNNILKPYIVTQRICDDSHYGCWNDDKTLSLSGNNYSDTVTVQKGKGLGGYIVSAVLNDGTFISANIWDKDTASQSFTGRNADIASGVLPNPVIIHFDINGNKGPNTVGEDIFIVYWDANKSEFVPAYTGASSADISHYCDSSFNSFYSGASCIQKYLKN